MGSLRRRDETPRIGGVGLVVLTAAAVAVSAFALCGLWAFWPSETLPPRETVRLAGYTASLKRDVVIAIAVACAGVLGALPWGLRALEMGAGNRELRWRSLRRSVVPLVVAAAAGTVVFVCFVLGGLAATGQDDPSRFAAIAAVLGFLADPAVRRFRGPR